MAQTGRMVIRGDAGDALGDSIYEARIYVRGERQASLGADCVEKEMRDEHHEELAELLQAAGVEDDDPSDFRRYGSARKLYTSTSTTRGATDDGTNHDRDGLRESAPVRPAHDRTRSSAPPARASTTSAGSGAKRKLPHFDDLLFLGATCRATRWRATASAATPTSSLGTRFAKQPLHLEIPVTIAGMSFGALSAPAKEALGRRRQRGRHVDHHRRRRHDARGARPLRRPGLPVPAVALRDEPRRPAPADAIEVVVGQGAKPGGGGMLLGQKISDRVAEMRSLPTGHRPAQRLPAPGLDRPGRPRDQDRRAARDHRLGEADLRQGRRHPHLLRRRSWRSRRAPT